MARMLRLTILSVNPKENDSGRLTNGLDAANTLGMSTRDEWFTDAGPLDGPEDNELCTWCDEGPALARFGGCCGLSCMGALKADMYPDDREAAE